LFYAQRVKQICADSNVLATQIQAAGYIVQSLRIVTNPFGEYLNTSSKDAALADLEVLVKILSTLTGSIRVRMAIGEARTVAEVNLIPDLIQAYGDVANCCVNVGCDELGLPDAALTTAAAMACISLSRNTPLGQGNFNFTANYNCPPGVPYFPAGYNTRADGFSFAIGLEYPDLLVQVLQVFASIIFRCIQQKLCPLFFSFSASSC
jgi:hypothetical protein